jgi:pimeloyl-ACP methyl ester carboxylesterase
MKKMSVLFLLASLLPLCLALSPSYHNVTLPTGVTLSVLLAGQPPFTPGAPTILLLHGFPEGSASWLPVLTAGPLDGCTLIAPDQRGYNASFSAASTPDASLLVPQLAADALALIAHFGGRAHLVAHDWGGSIAWWLASQQLPAILSLTILNMPHPQGWLQAVRTDPAQQRASAYVLTFIQPGLAGYLTANDSSVLASWFAGEPWFTGAARAALLDSWGVPGSVNAALGWYRANIRPHCPLTCTTWQCFQQGVSGEFDAMPNRGELAAGLRVRVLWGMRDSAFDNQWQLDYMAGRLAPGQINLTTYPDATHWIAQEMPGEVAQQVAGFVGGAV